MTLAFSVFFSVFILSVVAVLVIRLFFLGVFRLFDYWVMRKANKDIYFNREYARPKEDEDKE